MFPSQSDIEQQEYAAQQKKHRQRQKEAQREMQEKRMQRSASSPASATKYSATPSPTSPSASGSPSRRKQQQADHSRPLLLTQHSTYDTTLEEAPRRTVIVRNGQFEWNEDDRQTLKDRYSQSLPWRIYSHLPFSRAKLSRAHLYGTNAIRSTRYSLLTFLPVNLFEQLAPWHKPANFYFLCIAVLQAFPSISTTQGRPSILLPLLIVIIISAVKDALEDYGRAKQDYVKNHEQYKTFRQSHFHKVASKELLVGDIIMIEDGQRVPADCILLISGVGGGSIVYVDTKNLDGETNLKLKQVPRCLLKGYREDWRGVGGLDLKVVVDGPNGDMRSFSGELKLEGDGQGKKKKGGGAGGGGGKDSRAAGGGERGGDSSSESLSLDHFILSDCLVRNTPWLCGLVIYSGEDSKIRQNMKQQLAESRRKETRVFAMTKRIFLLMVALQLGMCIVAAALAGWYEGSDIGSAWYLGPDLDSVPVYAGLRFLTWFIIVKDFIPISLYVSLELVQFLQALFMQWDASMRVTLNGQQLSTRVNSSSLNEELAQVHFVFSDKTGTLTENSMTFKKCLIGSERYGTGATEAGLIRQAREEGKDVKQAIREFTEQKRQQKEQDEEKEREGKGRDDREKHVEFDEVDHLRQLLSKSKREVGETHDEKKKKEEKDGGEDEQDGKKGEERKAGGKGEEKQADSGREKTEAGKKMNGSAESSASQSGSEDGENEDEQERGKASAAADRSSASKGGKRAAGEEKAEKETSEEEAESEKGQAKAEAEGEEESGGGTADNRKSSQRRDGAKSPDRRTGKQDKSPTAEHRGQQKQQQGKDSSSASKAGEQQGSTGKQAKKNAKAKAGEHEKTDEEQAQLVRELFYCLALNNSVFPKVKDLEEAGKDEQRDSDEEGSPQHGLMEVVVNPVVGAIAGVGETMTIATSDAVDAVSQTFGAAGEAEGEEKDIEEGEAPETEKQPDEEEKEGYGDPNSGIVIDLEASSPDETALTSFAAVVGFELYSRNEGRIRLRVRDFGEDGGKDGGGGAAAGTGQGKAETEKPAAKQPEKRQQAGGQAAAEGGTDGESPDFSRHFEDFEEELLIEYNSKRKRMTVIVRPYDTQGRLMDAVSIYSKGADTAIASLLADDDPYWDSAIQPALGDFGGESLRTLVCAHSRQPADFYSRWRERMEEAKKAQGKDEKGHVDGECGDQCRLCAIENEVEEAAELVSLGCTGIEDKLQEGVPAALQMLLDAGMKVWMLTGDTVSTAVNIAMACNLIDSDMDNDRRLFVFDKDCDSADKIRTEIDAAMKKIEEVSSKARGKKGGKSRKTVEEEEEAGELPLFGLALHGDVWKKMQRSKKRKRKEGDGEDGSKGGKPEEQKKVSPDLFRQKMGKRQSRLNLHADTETAGKKDGKDKAERKEEQKAATPAHEDEEKKKDSAPSSSSSSSRQPKSSSSSPSSSSPSPSPSPSAADKSLMDRFFALSELCQSVIACRLEPKEKADIVDQMRERTGKTCLTGDHRVLTRRGWQSITRVQVGDEVLSFNIATYAMEWKPVLAVESHAVDPRNAADSLFRMQGSGMDVIATRDHRMLLARPESGNATRLASGAPVVYETVDELLGLADAAREVRGFAHNHHRSVICAGYSTQPAVKVVIPRLEQVCNWWWDRDRQRAFLQFLGFWLGDGYLDVWNGVVCIRQKKEAGKQWLEQLLPRVFPRCWYRNAEPSRPGCVVYTVRCPPLCNYLRLMAIGPLGYNPRDPQQLRSYPHFTKDEELAAEEQKSDYYQADNSSARVSTWTEAEMLVAFTAADYAADPERCYCCRRVDWVEGNEMLLCDGEGCPGPTAVAKGDWLCPASSYVVEEEDDAAQSSARRASLSAATTEQSTSRTGANVETTSSRSRTPSTVEVDMEPAPDADVPVTFHAEDAEEKLPPSSEEEEDEELEEEKEEGKEAPASLQPMDSDVPALEEGDDEAEVPLVEAVVDPAVARAAGAIVWWNNGQWIIIDGRWLYLKRWLGAQNVADVYSRLSRQQAVALLDGLCRADGRWKSVRYDDNGEPTGRWSCSNASFPLIDDLMLIGQLAGAAVHLSMLTKAGETKTVNGHRVALSCDRWRLYFAFTQPARIPMQTTPLAEPVDVSSDVEGRGYYQYADDKKVWCITVEGNANFLTQRPSIQRLASGAVGVRAHSVFVGNCLAIGDGNNDCLEPTCPVMLADRQRKPAMQVRQGDRLLGTGGRIATVVSQPFLRPSNVKMYRVTDITGSSFVVSQGHLVTLVWRRGTTVRVHDAAASSHRSINISWWRADTLTQETQLFPMRLKSDAGRPGTSEPLVFNTEAEAIQWGWSWFRSRFGMEAVKRVAEQQRTPVWPADALCHDDAGGGAVHQRVLPKHRPLPLQSPLPRVLEIGDLIDVRADRLAQPDLFRQLLTAHGAAEPRAGLQLVLPSQRTSQRSGSVARQDDVRCVASVKPEPAMTSCVGWEVDGDGRFVLGNGVLTHNCPMIEHADVGVGIAGVEGTSAVSSSDFALSQYRFLPVLLLVHGRLNHRRICILIQYIFYKTAFVVWALFFYGIYSQYSGQVFILDWAFQLHNVVYTALPILVFAIFDYDLSRDTLQSQPAIYRLTRYSAEHLSLKRSLLAPRPSSLFFSYPDFAEWLLVSLIHASLCFFFSIFAFNCPASPDPNGQEYGLFEQGAVIYTAIIFTTNLMLLFFFASWTWLHHLSLWGSLALYVIAMCVFSSSTVFDIAGGSLYFVFFRLLALPSFYLTVGLSVGSCLMVTMLWVEAKRWLWTREEMVWMEAEKLGMLKPDAEEQQADDAGQRKPSKGGKAKKGYQQLDNKEEEEEEQQDNDEEGKEQQERGERKEEVEMEGGDEDEDEEKKGNENGPVRRQGKKRPSDNERKQAAGREEEEDVKEEKKEAATPLPPSGPPLRRSASDGVYTGSLFSYTPGIRSLRNVVAGKE